MKYTNRLFILISYFLIQFNLFLQYNRIFSSISNIGSGYLIGKYGYVKRYIRGGSLLLIISCYLVSLFGVDLTYIFEFFSLSLLGLSCGLIMQNLILVTQQSANKKCEYLYILYALLYF